MKHMKSIKDIDAGLKTYGFNEMMRATNLRLAYSSVIATLEEYGGAPSLTKDLTRVRKQVVKEEKRVVKRYELWAKQQ